MECHLFRKIKWIELKTKDLGDWGQLVRYEKYQHGTCKIC